MRTLSWDGCVNVRDLGGLPTEDGAVTRFRGVVRADNLCGLSTSGRQALLDYGVTRIVDLRWAEELAADGPHGVSVEVVHVSLLGEREGPFAAIDRRVRRLTDPKTGRGSGYLEFVDVFAENIASAVTAVGQAPEGAVVVHCAGGVDRTGLVAAFLLRLAGVAVDDISRDYAESETNWAPHLGTWLAEAPDEEEREFRRFLARCPPGAIVRPLEAVEQRHGDVRTYLENAGAPSAALDAARTRLRDD